MQNVPTGDRLRRVERDLELYSRRPHLATAIVARAAVTDLAILSLDRRVQENASELGFEVLPLGSETGS